MTVPASASQAAAPDELTGLLAAAGAGDRDAVARLVDEYGDHLLRVVRRRLPRRVRTLYDSDDFVQAVWATFFLHGIDPARFAGREQLLAYLGRIAANKVADQVRRRLIARKATLNREVRLDDVPAAELAAPRTETASQVAIARERMERLLRDQPPHYRAILARKAGGDSAAEIAAATGLNEGTVRRVLSKFAAKAARE